MGRVAERSFFAEAEKQFLAKPKDKNNTYLAYQLANCPNIQSQHVNTLCTFDNGR